MYISTNTDNLAIIGEVNVGNLSLAAVHRSGVDDVTLAMYSATAAENSRFMSVYVALPLGSFRYVAT